MGIVGALAAPPASAAVRGDFNGDHRGDLAIGAPGEDVSGGANAGAVTIVYAGKTKLRPHTARLFTQKTKGIPGSPGSTDRFGSALAAGDFNHDGRADLAVGVPGDSVAGASGAGAVEVLYGAKGGLRAKRSRLFTQNTKGVKDQAEAADLFGGALTTGDFNGDHHDDLAIGVGQANVNGENGAEGAVEVLYGSRRGLRAKRNQLWTQDSPGVADSADGPDFFGGALAAGDLGRGKRDDLAIGVPAEGLPAGLQAGAVNVLYGRAKGLKAKGDQFFSQDDPPDIDGVAEPGDQFGGALTVGDFNHDKRGDLGVGVPHEAVGATADAGAVNVIYGSPAGLSSAGDQVFVEGQIGDTPDVGDHLGAALTSGRFDQGPFADLVAGIPGENANAGAFDVVSGSNAGLVASSYSLLLGAAAGDSQGSALGSGRFGKDPLGDLAVGVPGDASSPGGNVRIFYGQTGGLSFGAVDFLDQDDGGIPTAGSAFDRFGAALAP
jgi:hypothetical protein